MRKSLFLYTLFIFAALGSVSIAPMAFGEELASALLTPIEPSSASSISNGQQDSTVVRSRYVQINFDILKGEHFKGADDIVLHLFPDVTLSATKLRIEWRSAKAYTWFGHLKGYDHSQAILVVGDGVMAGNITANGKIYQIRFVSDGIHAVREINQAAFPEELPPIPGNTNPDELNVLPQSSPQPDAGDFIDVMVVYTPAAKIGAGGTTPIQSLIQLAVDETNQSYINSGINQRLRLVHNEEVSYTESGNLCGASTGDLERLAGTMDGYMDNVHALRDSYGADLVSLVTETGNPNACGCGYLMTTVSTAFAANAFMVTRRDCATGYYSFGHELGHNMGARHDWYVDPEITPYPYSHGYVYTPGRWRTIMAYNNECSPLNCTRVQYWSNPDVLYGGVPMGVPEGSFHPADNRKTLNNTASTVANFRQSQVPTPDIKANNLNGPITIHSADVLKLVVSLNPAAAYTGQNADWWLVASTPFGWYYYNVGAGTWEPGLNVTYQGPLFNLASMEVLNITGLPAGAYTLYFGIDTTPNGIVDGQLFYDSVAVTVTP